MKKKERMMSMRKTRVEEDEKKRAEEWNSWNK